MLTYLRSFYSETTLWNYFYVKSKYVFNVSNTLSKTMQEQSSSNQSSIADSEVLGTCKLFISIELSVLSCEFQLYGNIKVVDVRNMAQLMHAFLCQTMQYVE